MRETVVLVHGLWLHGVAMLYLKRRIARRGYDVKAYSYPTVRLNLAENAKRLVRYCEKLPTGRFHLVSHSMGGLVVMKAAEALSSTRLGRIVLLAPPYRDSYAGRRVQRLPGGCTILGRCMGEWLGGVRDTPLRHLDLGVIAGTGSVGLGRIFAPGLPQPNDGVVSVDETRVPGMRDHIVVPASHTLMLVSATVAHQVCAYLDHGKFDRVQTTGASVN